MRIYFALIFAAMLACMGCGRRGQNHNTSANAEQEQTTTICDSIQNEPEFCEEGDNTEEYDDEILEGNDARFHNWTDEDWFDNDYFRILRKFFDAYVRGEIEGREELLPLKPLMTGKFVIYNAEPFISGGLFVSFVFLESPNDIYNVWIYSYVEHGEVYIDLSSVRSIQMSDRKFGMTKEDIYRIIEEHPENKLW